MTEKSKNCVNPCKAKGRSGGSRFGGVVYQIGGSFVRIGGCECNQPFFDLGLRTSAVKRYALGTESSPDAGQIIAVTDPGKPFPPDSLPLVSCNERFRYPDSEGTLFYKNLLGPLTDFNGCQGLEEDGIREKSLRHAPPKQEFSGWTEGSDTGDANEDVLEGDEFLVSLKRPTEYEATQPDAETLGAEKRTGEKWAIYVQAAMEDLKLTYKQKSAFNRLYGEDGRKTKTYKEVAKELKISVYSVKNRIMQIRAKLNKRFPEFKHLTPKKRQIKGLYPAPDRQQDGLFYRSEAKKVAQLFRVDPKTGARLEISPLEKHKNPTSQSGISVKKEKEALTLWWPKHNGTWSAWVPTGEKRKGKKSILLLKGFKYKASYA